MTTADLIRYLHPIDVMAHGWLTDTFRVPLTNYTQNNSTSSNLWFNDWRFATEISKSVPPVPTTTYNDIRIKQGKVVKGMICVCLCVTDVLANINGKKNKKIIYAINNNIFNVTPILLLIHKGLFNVLFFLCFFFTKFASVSNRSQAFKTQKCCILFN